MMLAAWLWVKKHWEILLGLLIALLGFLLGVSVKKTPVIVQGDDPEKKKIEDQTQKAIDEAQKEHDQAVAEAQAEEQKAQQDVVTEEQKKTSEVEGDVDQTNEYLKNVSKDIGGS